MAASGKAAIHVKMTNAKANREFGRPATILRKYPASNKRNVETTRASINPRAIAKYKIFLAELFDIVYQILVDKSVQNMAMSALGQYQSFNSLTAHRLLAAKSSHWAT